MAKEKKKSEGEKGGKKGKKSKAKAQAASAKHDSPATKVSDAVRTAKRKAADLASNPAVAEVVAATLVAAAAALRNPDKARELAASARDELKSVGKTGAGQGNAFWQLALDVARRSVDSLAQEGSGKSKKTKRKSSD